MSEAPVTFVNVLTVEPARQQELVDALREGAEHVVRRPGLVSLRLLAALDGSRVLSIAEWSNADAAKATMDDPQIAAHARQAAAIATPAPGLYRLVADHAA